MNYTCEVCGKTFSRSAAHAARSKHLFCSRACLFTWNKGENNPAYQGGEVECTCEQCGKVFNRSQSSARKGNHNFCSRACYLTWQKEMTPAPIKNLICEGCGKAFHRKPSTTDLYQHHFCSWACRQKSLKVICEQCGKEFTRTLSQVTEYQHHFCSQACHYTWKSGIEMTAPGRMVTCTCEVCGKEFERTVAHVRRVKHLFCSQACFGIGNRGANNPAYRTGNIEFSCQNCGKLVSVEQHLYTRSKSHFCSSSCRSTYMRGERHPLYQVIYDYCAYCGEEIRITARKIGKRNFCCRSHANQSHSEYISGENNPRYVDGMAIERYPYEFIKLAPLIRERDQNQCWLCHMTREEHGKELNVHHIDYDIHHNEPMNLVTLCRWCHGKMHGSPEQRYQWRLFWSDQSSRFQPLNMSTTSE